MSFRKSVLLIGCVSLLLMIGLLMMLGLAIRGRAAVAHSQPTPTPTKTPRAILATTNTPTPVVLAVATALPSDALSDSPPATSGPTGPSMGGPISSGVTMSSPTDTLVPADAHAGTPIPSPTPSAAPTDGLTPTPKTSPLSPGRITGRLLLDGAPVSAGTKLKLENRSYKVIAETTVGADGVYAFTDVDPSSQGYNVLFAQEWNPQYGTNQVVSWGWLGPVAVGNGAVVELPDFDVSLLGLRQVNPAPDAIFSAAALSPQNPIRFEWTAYPQALKYWMDLVRGEEQKLVWQPLTQATSLTFDGTLGNGARIQPGDYWWGVGARRELGPYKLTVYGYLPGLIIEP